MPKRLPALPKPLIAVAARRHGVVTTREVRAVGIGPAAQSRRVAGGLLEPIGHGVLVVPGYRDHLTELAAIQVRHPALVAERATAAWVRGLDGFRDGPPPHLDLAWTGPGRTPSLPGHRVHRADLPDGAIDRAHGILVTSAGWTLGELEGVDVDTVELAVESALRSGTADEGELAQLIARRPGASLLRQALSRRRVGAPPTESYAETRFLQRVVRPMGLEDPDRQVEVRVPGLRRPYRCDFVFRRARALDVEIDGRHTHDGDRDALRDHHVELQGLEVVRFPAWRVEHRPAEIQARLDAELRAVS